MNCPICSVELKIADRQGVEIDYCPKCRGVWLDRGELDKIIERANGASFTGGDEDDREAYGYDREHDREHGREGQMYDRDGRTGRGAGRPKRESIFGEIFDIFG